MSKATTTTTTPKQSLSDLAANNAEFRGLVMTYKESFGNPSLCFATLYKLEDFRSSLSSQEWGRFDTFLESGEGSEAWMPKNSVQIAASIAKMSAMLPKKECEHCRKSCSMGTKCEVSGHYHM
jgi:hypothetical protein